MSEPEGMRCAVCGKLLPENVAVFIRGGKLYHAPGSLECDLVLNSEHAPQEGPE